MTNSNLIYYAIDGGDKLGNGICFREDVDLLVIARCCEFHRQMSSDSRKCDGFREIECIKMREIIEQGKKT